MVNKLLKPKHLATKNKIIYPQNTTSIVRTTNWEKSISKRTQKHQMVITFYGSRIPSSAPYISTTPPPHTSLRQTHPCANNKLLPTLNACFIIFYIFSIFFRRLWRIRPHSFFVFARQHALAIHPKCSQITERRSCCPTPMHPARPANPYTQSKRKQRQSEWKIGRLELIQTFIYT